MKKNFIIFVVGTVIGMVLQQVVLKGQMGVEDYVIFVVTIVVFTFDISWFILYLSMMLTLPLLWLVGEFHWVHPLFMVMVMYSLYHKVFSNRGTTLFVERGDVLRFPVIEK